MVQVVTKALMVNKKHKNHFLLFKTKVQPVTLWPEEPGLGQWWGADPWTAFGEWLRFRLKHGTGTTVGGCPGGTHRFPNLQ